jgi:hypothetical protein
MLLVELLEDIAEIDFLRDDCMQIFDLDTLLLHRVTVTDSDATVVKRIVVNCHAERSSDRILTTISLTD